MSWPLAIWCAAIGLASAGVALTRTQIVHTLVWLVATLLALAAAFLALGASFAGAIQILIYAGAITVVFVFVVMTVDTAAGARAREAKRLRGAWKPPAAAVALVILPFALVLEEPGSGAPAAVPPKDLGALLFGPWAAAVELASCLLLAALLGVRNLGRVRGGPNE